MSFFQEKFEVGQRVQLSALGHEAGLASRRKDIANVGAVLSVDRFNSPTVLWDGRKSASKYHPDFIEPADIQKATKP